MNDPTAPLEWLTAMRGTRHVKVLAGIRGIGKTSTLAAWRNQMLKDGIPEERIVCVDAEEPVLRRLTTSDEVLQFLFSQIPATGPAMLLIDEPTVFLDYEGVLAELLGHRRLDIYLTLSSRRLYSEGLSDFLRGALSIYEMMPPVGGIREEPQDSRNRWNAILLRDVLTAKGVADVTIAERIAGYLSDTEGDPVSLRAITAATSPHGRQFSPNTAEAYLTALENAYVIERCYRWNADTEERLATGYRIFFTDPTLRRAQFGSSHDELRRERMNARWLELRHASHRVYLAEDPGTADDLRFVVRP